MPIHLPTVIFPKNLCNSVARHELSASLHAADRISPRELFPVRPAFATFSARPRWARRLALHRAAGSAGRLGLHPRTTRRHRAAAAAIGDRRGRGCRADTSLHKRAGKGTGGRQPDADRAGRARAHGSYRVPACSLARPRRRNLPLAQPAAAGDITLNFVNADVREVLPRVLGDILHLNYADRSQGPGQYHHPDQPADPTAGCVAGAGGGRCARAGSVLVEANGIYRLVSSDDAAHTGTLALSVERRLDTGDACLQCPDPGAEICRRRRFAAHIAAVPAEGRDAAG